MHGMEQGLGGLNQALFGSLDDSHPDLFICME
jgi:hypothetical protein